MSNIIDVYHKIDKLHLAFTVSYVEPFSFIKSLTGNPQKCIIAYQQVKSKSISSELKIKTNLIF